MGPRRHVPFDVFAMQVDVPVSMMVCDGDYGWTCGQCPLDRQGRVVAPGDLVAQAEFVCDMVEVVVRRGELDIAAVAKLNVYYSDPVHDKGQAALRIFRNRFAHRPVIVPIRVPYFYYDGMMIEVDVFTGGSTQAPMTHLTGSGTLQIARSGELIWACITTDLTGMSSLSEGIGKTRSLLLDHGLDVDHMISDRWFLSGAGRQHLQYADFDTGFITNPHALVLSQSGGSDTLVGELTFTTKPSACDNTCEEQGTLKIFSRRSDPFFWISGVCTEQSAGLVEQTRSIMSGIERSLDLHGLSFKNVTKLTAHYVGGATPEDLHGNMTVRHGYYSSPGPASTGLPVFGLLDPQCRISIDAVAST